MRSTTALIASSGCIPNVGLEPVVAKAHMAPVLIVKIF